MHLIRINNVMQVPVSDTHMSLTLKCPCFIYRDPRFTLELHQVDIRGSLQNSGRARKGARTSLGLVMHITLKLMGNPGRLFKSLRKCCELVL